MDIVLRAARHQARTAVIHNDRRYTYETLLDASQQLHRKIAPLLPLHAAASSGPPPRIGLYAAPGPEFVAGTWAIWQAGGIVVPLATSHPPKELSYVFQDAGLSTVLVSEEHESKLTGLAKEHSTTLQTMSVAPGELFDRSQRQKLSEAERSALSALAPGSSQSPAASPDSDPGSSRGALIIYTSGTTGKPKGVLHTHRSVMAQVSGLVSAWDWQAADHILHSLPLHHIHGIVNALYCPHHVGAAVDFMPKFTAPSVWSRLQEGHTSVFMGVPTMYSLLLSNYDTQTAGRQAALRSTAAALRLTVSGSSACPVPIMSRWQQLSGQPLLERYGMTEIGMALSNPLQGERRPGSVGLPLPGVEACLAEDGELLVRGATVFKEYWGKEAATKETFDERGFFKTGDTASLSGSPPYYSILGRTSVDIIKSGGYKISALEVEGGLLEHPAVEEVAVVGVKDEVYGELVGALVVLRSGQPAPTGAQLRAFCNERMAAYQSPRVWKFISSLPRNAMGKVNKKALKAEYFPETDGVKGADAAV
ncbi:MAG: hypothetical protein WDW38_005288 [Sanguina aurantia]